MGAHRRLAASGILNIHWKRSAANMNDESGVSTRTPTVGPEYKLVQAFSESGVPKAAAGHEVTVFIEPKLRTGYPDIVVVYWDRDLANTWVPARACLAHEDLTHLQYLHHVRVIPLGDLEARIGRTRAARTVERLIAAGVIRFHRGELRRKPLTEIFAVKRIVAVEAKMTDWKKGIQQAILNTWFASEAFLLLPCAQRRPDLFARAKEVGVGVVTQGQTLSQAALVPKRERLPRSHVSWLFNEWVWRGYGHVRS